MGKAERYLEHAEECLEFSKSMTDPMWRTQLVAIAAQWRKAAEWEHRIISEAQRTTPEIRRSGRIKSLT